LGSAGCLVSVDVGGELWGDGPGVEGSGLVFIRVAAAQYELGVTHARVDGGERDVWAGSAPAWRFERAEASVKPNAWAIHTLGMDGKRAGALRGVPVAVRSGFTSLVISFRNDGEAPPSADGRYTLGQSEWRDIVHFGWSLGGAIALPLADLSAHSDRIVGLILDAPVLDWQTTQTANAGAPYSPDQPWGLLEVLGDSRLVMTSSDHLRLGVS
jgi:hypothetical protein